MVQKYVAALVVLLMFAMTTPAFAGDLVNPKLLPPAFSRTSFGQLAGSVAFAPPQAGQGQSTPQSGQTQPRPPPAASGLPRARF